MDLYDNKNILLTRYVDQVIFDKRSKNVEIQLNLGPDNWKPSHKLLFENVSNFYEEVIDDEEYPGKNNFTDTVIGFDEVPGGLCLHLTTVEYGFKAPHEPKFIEIIA